MLFRSAFGCEIPEPFVWHGVRQVQSGGVTPQWINLEYLSAEGFVERAHGLPSPVMTGPAQGWVKHFFYPGFTSRTGGLLREPDLLSLQDGFDRCAHRLALCPDLPSGGRLISLFCYEPPGLPQLLQAWSPTDRLLVTPGRALNAVRSITRKIGRAHV